VKGIVEGTVLESNMKPLGLLRDLLGCLRLSALILL
jgi:hypothetical protein